MKLTLLFIIIFITGLISVIIINEKHRADVSLKEDPDRNNDDFDTNPANGLPMIGGIDIAGNPYGATGHHHDD